MVELKFTGERYDGKLVCGVVAAESTLSCRKKIGEITLQHNIKVKNLAKKKTFVYKAQRGDEKPVTGEKAAFDSHEVTEALESLGYRVLSIQQKYFEINRNPSGGDILMFVKVSADMLEQNMPYGEIMYFLINDTRNRVLREAAKDINKELKTGADTQQAFMKHQSVFGPFTAYMLGLASKSGNMTEIYKATVKFMERNLEFKKNIKSAILSPLVTVAVLIIATLWYVCYIFPETAKLFRKFRMKIPPMTDFTLQMSSLLGQIAPFIIAAAIAALILFLWYYRTPQGKTLFDRSIFRIPVLGELLHKSTIEIFCRVFYTLYTGSAESITPIRIAAEATGNKYFEKQIKERAIPKMMNRGVGIADGLMESGVFSDIAISKFRSGEETGNIKGATLQLANYLESDTKYRMKNFVEWVQIGISLFILIIMLLLTFVSAETATIQPKRPGISIISR